MLTSITFVKYYGSSLAAQCLISIYWVILTSSLLIIECNTYSSSIASECHFIDFIVDHGLSQLVNEASLRSTNILDLVFSNQNVSVSNGKQLLSDHYLFFFNLDFVTFRRQSYGSSFSKSPFNNQNFNTNLHGFFQLMSTDNSLNPHYADQWYSCLIGFFNSYVKFKRSKRMKLPLFYSSHTVHLIIQKETSLLRLSREGLFLQAFKLREQLKELSISIELDKKLFINQFYLSSTRHCFKLLRSLGSSTNLPTTIFHNGATFNNEFEIAPEFNNYFVPVFNNKVISPPPDITSSSNVCLNAPDLSLENITVLLKKCQDSRNTGADLIPSFVSFNSAEALSPVMPDLFYCILSWKHWPEQWKHFTVTPLFKDGAHNDKTNYGPISILPFLSLILEKILFDFIYPKIRHLIKREQHGFMKSRSTVSQLIAYLDLVYSSRDNNIPALSLSFDVLSIIWKRLTLSRITCCYLNWKTSDLIWISFTCSTRTGSTDIKVSGSTNLFPFHTLLPLVCPKVVYWARFCSFYSSTTLPMIFQLVTSICLLMISKFSPLQMSLLFTECCWFSTTVVFSQLPQIPSLKCKAPTFGGFDEIIQLMLGSHGLPYVNKIADLGFIVTKNLSWKERINFRLLKSSRVSQFLKRNIPDVISVNRKKLLLKSLLLPILLYGTPVWCTSVLDLEQMELFQYKAIRWIKACLSHVSGLSQLDLLPISHLLVRDDIILLWKLYNNQIDVDSNLATIWLPLRSSTNNIFVVPKTHKFSSDHNFFVRAPRAANELFRQQISFELPLGIFKSALNKFLTFKTKSTFNIDHSCSYFVKCFCKSCRSWVVAFLYSPIILSTGIKSFLLLLLLLLLLLGRMDAGYTSCGASYEFVLRMALIKTIGGELTGVFLFRLMASHVFWILHGVSFVQFGHVLTGLEEKF